MKSIIVLVLTIIVTTSANCQVMFFPFGNKVAVDGDITENEWNDADSLTIEIKEGWSIKVKYKHDKENLLFQFRNLRSPIKVSGMPFRFPEILINTDSSTPDEWSMNTHWFHVSATDCHSLKMDDYTNCMLEANKWEANNFPQMIKGDIIIEVKIPFSIIKYEINKLPYFMMAFRMNDTMGNRTLFPLTANEKNPSTWLDVELQ